MMKNNAPFPVFDCFTAYRLTEEAGKKFLDCMAHGGARHVQELRAIAGSRTEYDFCAYTNLSVYDVLHAKDNPVLMRFSKDLSLWELRDYVRAGFTVYFVQPRLYDKVRKLMRTSAFEA